MLRADIERIGTPPTPLAVEPHAGREFVELEGTNREEDDALAEAVELRELLREIPPEAATMPGTEGEDDADPLGTLCLLFILAPVGVEEAPPDVPGARPRPVAAPLVLPPAVLIEEPPERNGGGVFRCAVSSLFGTAGLFAASIATLGNPPVPDGRLDLGALPVAAVSITEESCCSVRKDFGFLPGEDMFDLGLTLGRGDTIGPVSEETMLLVFEVVLPAEERVVTFIATGSAVAASIVSVSGKVRGDGVGRESLTGSGTVIGGGVEIGPDSLEAALKRTEETNEKLGR